MLERGLLSLWSDGTGYQGAEEPSWREAWGEALGVLAKVSVEREMWSGGRSEDLEHHDCAEHLRRSAGTVWQELGGKIVDRHIGAPSSNSRLPHPS
eukprot:3356010-Rhodomonas_salina.1